MEYSCQRWSELASASSKYNVRADDISPRTFSGSVCSNKFFTSSKVAVRLSKEALLRGGNS